MNDQKTRAIRFAELHQKGTPLVIYNVWDGGSAKAVAASGATAIATGDHPVAFAHGFSEEDFDQFTFATHLDTVKEVVSRVGELPVSMDISNADNLNGEELKKRVRAVLDIGVVGVNFEDRVDNNSLNPIAVQCERIALIREAAQEAGIPLFINARTDLFALADSGDHSSKLEDAIKRAEAYKQAGGDGFFAPRLVDIELIKELCERVELPVNIIRVPGAPSSKELIAAGVSRISYGPVPHIQMIEWLQSKAAAAIQYQE